MLVSVGGVRFGMDAREYRGGGGWMLVEYWKEERWMLFCRGRFLCRCQPLLDLDIPSTIV